MARVKISEYQAKSLLLSNYHGLCATTSTTVMQIESHFPNQNLVVKVDQGIKKRGKLGLVKVNVTPTEIPDIIQSWSNLGWSSFLVEPVVEHSSDSEHYLALERVRSGWQVSYSKRGGIEVESSWGSIKQTFLRFEGLTWTEVPSPTIKNFIILLLTIMENNHLVFLEMNPILIRGETVIPLDMAAEVDDTGSTLTPVEESHTSPSESQIHILDTATPASLKFKLINPNGRIWMLLSGGGASLVLTDEVADQEMGNELANYGEYSGAPKSDDVYSYTKIILNQLLKSSQTKHKALVVAGGVANFTDVAQTFKGLIQAFDEQKLLLLKAGVKVFVRRGGPNESRGLAIMKKFLTDSKLLGSVHSHNDPLTLVINEVKEYLT